MGRTAKQGMGIYKDDFEGYIRKLTPTECCRLQGFIDTYFLDKNGVQIISNTQIYKCLGNSFTVPVIAHILKGLTQIDR